MKSLKRILLAVSLFYFGIAVLFQIIAISLFLEIRPPVPTSLFFLSEGFFGLLSVGFIALFIGTIFFKNKEESMTCKSEPIPETGRNQKTLSVTGVMMLILFLNAGISFFAFAVVKSDGSPEIYGDRYVMAYKGKVIREIDRAEYYRESGRSTKSTAQVFAAFLLFFTGGILTAYLPEIKGFRVDFARFPFSRTRHLTRSRGQVRVSSRQGRKWDWGTVFMLAVMFLFMHGIAVFQHNFISPVKGAGVELFFFLLLYCTGIVLMRMADKEGISLITKNTLNIAWALLIGFAWLGGIGLLTNMVIRPIGDSLGGIAFLTLFFGLAGGLSFFSRKKFLKSHDRFRDGLKHADSAVRQKTLGQLFHELGKCTDEYGDLTEMLLDALRDPHAPVRLSAAATFAVYINETRPGSKGSVNHVIPTEMKAKIISALSAAMKDQDPKVRQQATLALGKIEDMEDINPLTDALRDEDAAVRNTAVQALQYFDDPLAVPHLLPLLADEHHHDAVLKVIENLCRAVQTLQFGYDPENQIRDNRRTVYDPDLSRLTIPLPELTEIVIYAQTCNIEQVRSLVRYAGQFYGENPLKNSICLTLYGNLHETDEKLFRELGSLCKNVIKK
ncbi:MAG: HEAT repeat domain-containing protein [Desulfococcaceae bacterium]|jgi:hypothetical protein|nr:HEAT repeat domain-containing protein [Desulfococcaceae bacterium]